MGRNAVESSLDADRVEVVHDIFSLVVARYRVGDQDPHARLAAKGVEFLKVASIIPTMVTANGVILLV
jgi:hypothetical protein